MTSVCVHGLGYIGLPTAAMLANYGYEVHGYDVDDGVRETLRDGGVHLDEPGLRAFVTQALESGQLTITDEVVPAKYQLICVPTPFDEERKSPDLSYVTEAARALTPQLRAGDTVILESTVPPGTSTGTLRPVLESGGLRAGEDFAIVHCPETVMPGNIITELQENARIVGGINGVSTESAVRLYERFVRGEVHTTSDPTVAEFVKLIQNTYRDVNIALANEIARIAHDYDIDSREAIDLANEHPRVDILDPGPGVGGHCLPVDPWFLGVDSDSLWLIPAARGVNDSMPSFVVELLREGLGTLAGKKIAVLGIAYKADVSDTRMSPGLALVRELRRTTPERALADGGSPEPPAVSVHDPHVTETAFKLDDLETATADADALVVATHHQVYDDLDPSSLFDRMAGNVLVDTKGRLERALWQKAGFDVLRL